MRPRRSTVTTSPWRDSSGRAWACGRRTSTPPCIIGAVIMKMIRSTNATSTRDVTLMSAFRAARLRRRGRSISEPPLACERRDQLPGESLELGRDEVLPRGEDVVGDDRGDGDGEARHGGDQRLGDARL